MLIEDNPRLSELSLGELRSVGTLEVRDNPALSSAALAALPTLESIFVGNAD